MGTATAILYLLLAVVLCLGCRGQATGDGSSPPPGRSEVHDTAGVVCDGEGARVLAQQVEASPDGVHLLIYNRLEGSADLEVDYCGGGMGWSVPAGESRRVANVPPGKVRIACYSRSWDKEKLSAIDGGSIRVLARDAGYKSAKLDCPRGKLAGGMKPYTEEEMGGREGGPTDLLRDELSGSLREDDLVEVAGKTQNRDERTVRVVRGGKVVANAHYMQVSNGWLGGLTENRVGF